MSSGSVRVGKKGDRFRRYLEENGVTKTISQILVMLYRQDEKPEDPLRYVKEKLINDCTMDSCIGQLRSRIAKATEENVAIQSNMQNLQEQNKTLQQAIEKLTAVIGSTEVPTLKECVLRPTSDRLRCVSSRSSRARKTISCSGTLCTLVSSCNLSTRFPEIMFNDTD